MQRFAVTEEIIPVSLLVHTYMRACAALQKQVAPLRINVARR